MLVFEAVSELHETHTLEQLLVLHLIALCEQVQVRQGQLRHRGHGGEAGREVLGRLGHERAIGAVHRTEVEARVCDRLGKARHHIEVRVKLDLSGAVEQEK